MRLASALRVTAAAVLVALGSAPSPPRADAAPPRVTAVPLEGASVEGEFRGLDATGVRVGEREAPLPLRETREVRFPAPSAPVPSSAGSVGLRVTLVGGEEVRGAFVSGAGEAIEVRPPDFGSLRLPFDAIARVEAESAFDGPCDEPGRARPPRPGRDVVYARSGDSFDGTLHSVSEAGVVVETGKDRRTTVSWKDLVILHLDNAGSATGSGADEVSTEVETVGGSRLLGPSATADAQSLAIETRSGVKARVPVSSLRAIRFAGGAFVYASEVAFTSTYTPYYQDDASATKVLEAWNGARADRTAAGCPLSIAGVAYRRGVAVRSRSVVTVPLGRAYAKFSSWFGIDDEVLRGAAGPRGDVTARVLVDGKEAWSSAGSVRGGEPARRVGPIDVRGAETLVLEVDFGKELHQRDHADWADPVLVRAK
jgi:hypothetical protein